MPDTVKFKGTGNWYWKTIRGHQTPAESHAFTLLTLQDSGLL